MIQKQMVLSLVVLALAACQGSAFQQPTTPRLSPSPIKTHHRFDTTLGIFNKIGEFFEELDAFVDDATARRLGNGAAFYGKRKSSFYGKEDKGRKADKNVPDPLEDYQGPTSSGFFKWVPDENGQMRPVTRMKEKNLERNPQFWDRVYAEKDRDE
ncbi:hypothetical protein IV203_015105 [Nitzschia inconspicua]|uniref:Uncharacterized protein n=1 Tax=Nitzschia inconspicua TaxID=303405 RepID=A0A9K3LD56_9STRA|nr:hypothetical protein IV203_015105 [Nitzschia inconspicua]